MIYGTFLRSRNPTSFRLVVGGSSLRLMARMSLGVESQPPPRKERLEFATEHHEPSAVGKEQPHQSAVHSQTFPCIS